MEELAEATLVAMGGAEMEMAVGPLGARMVVQTMALSVAMMEVVTAAVTRVVEVKVGAKGAGTA